MKIKWTVFWIGLFFLAGCSPQKQLEPVSSTPQQTPSPIRVTSTLTPTPTIERIPSKTKTVPYVLPTSKPEPTVSIVSAPQKYDPNVSYHLTEWNPEKAQQLVDKMWNYTEIAMGNFYDQYYQLVYVDMVQKEALVRFPDAEQRNAWLWEDTFVMLSRGYSGAMERYAGFIEDALNRKEFELSSIKDWFFVKEHRLDISVQNYPPPAGYSSTKLLYLQYYSCGAYIMLAERDGVYQTIPLLEHYSSFGCSQEVVYRDINEDGNLELVLSSSASFRFMNTVYMNVYSLDTFPPRLLHFEPELDSDEITYYEFVDGEILFEQGENGPDLLYQWDGAAFRQKQKQFVSLEYWQKYVDSSQYMILDQLLIPAINGDRDALALVNEYSTAYPINVVDENEWTRYYSNNELHFALAIKLSENGYSSEARDEMRKIVSGDQWVNGAKVFLESGKVLDTCLVTDGCYPHISMQDLINWIPAGRLKEAPDLLKQMGVPIEMSGEYDFNQDGTIEEWIYFRDPFGASFIYALETEGDFLIGEQIFNDYIISPVLSIDYALLDPRAAEKVYLVSISQPDEVIEVLYHHIEDHSFSNAIGYFDVISSAEEINSQMLQGEISPKRAVEQLIQLQRSETYCESSYIFGSETDCQSRKDKMILQLTYYLGLAYDLAGDADKAVEAYQYVWQTSPDGAYGWMASLRLEPVP